MVFRFLYSCEAFSFCQFYDDFFRATGYIENTQETGAVTSVLPVCDSDECCKNDMILTSVF